MGTKLDHNRKGQLGDRLAELRRVTVNGTRSYGEVMGALQSLIEGRGLSVAQAAQLQRFYPQRDYSRYNPYLHSLGDQLQLLRELNQRMPGMLRVSDAWLDLDTASQHVQGVEDLEVFYVQLGTLEATCAFNQELVRLTQPAIYDSGFARDARSMRLHRTAHRYEPGIHRVWINLVDNWDPEKGRTVDAVRARTVRDLAAVEAVGAYGLQDPRLYQSQDGVNLPYFDCAGLEQCDGFRLVPYSIWNEFGRGVGFSSCSADSVDRNFAAPSLVPQGAL